MHLVTPDEALQIEQALLREKFSAFTEKTFKTVSPGDKYLHNWHIDCMAEYLTACYKRDITRLIINIPPRYMKSIATSVAFPAWVMGRDPSSRFMCASYSAPLAFEHSTACRFVVGQSWYKHTFPQMRLAADQNEKGKFNTTKRGHRIATSVGGTVTGLGGDYVIIDDPHSAVNADSDVVRESQNQWFDNTASTRLNDKEKGVIIVIMQRLHERDMTGMLLERDGWEHLKLQGINEKPRTISVGGFTKTLEEGEVLHPEREEKERLEQMQLEQGGYFFSSQYQQNPAPDGGGEFKKDDIQYYDWPIAHDKMNVIITVDPAHGKKKHSDNTAMCVIGLNSDQNVYLLDAERDKLELRERIDRLFELVKKYQPTTVYYERYGMMADIDAIKMEMDRRNYRFTIVEVGGQLMKAERIRRLKPLFFQKRMYLPRRLIKANWNNEPIDIIHQFINEELVSFPVAKNDDMIDALSRLMDTPLDFPSEGGGFDYERVYGG